MRMDHEQQLHENERRRSSTDEGGKLRSAQEHAEHAVIEAEKFRATVSNPGNLSNLDKFMQTEQNEENDQQPNLQNLQIPNIGSGVSDDDFFHLTCHIEPNLIHKIEKGEFVELEKLLPKEKFGKNGDDNRLEWVHKDGGTFLVPANRDVKIGSFRKWEQAFCAYATIYCSANPQRSKEIWQYIMVINTAASSYFWENVYNYDITFRHLMAFNPQRSWAVTYNQMWNLSMRDPIPRTGQKGYPSYNRGNNFSYQHNKTNSNVNGNGNQRKAKSDYCWNFNKGVPCKVWE